MPEFRPHAEVFALLEMRRVRTTGVEEPEVPASCTAGDGNGGFTAGVQGYNGFLNLTTGGTDVVGGSIVLRLRSLLFVSTAGTKGL